MVRQTPKKIVPESVDLAARASGNLRPLLDTAASVAASRGEPVWAVGGLVRDLLTGRESRDIDLVVLCDLEEFAEALGVALEAEPTPHREFLTVRIELGDGYRVDVVRARAEVYEYPGAMPSVRPGSLLEDLFRRDFTVNAMALQLGPGGQFLVDPFGGRLDLERGLLRTLHDLSFRDDPTRITRGLNLVERMRLDFEQRTASQATRAVAEGAFERVSPARLRLALEGLFADPVVTRRQLSRIEKLGLEDAISPGLRIGPDADARLRRLIRRREVESAGRRDWLTTLLACAWDLGESELGEIARRMDLDAASCHWFQTIPSRVKGLCGRLEALDSAYARFKAGEALGVQGRAVAACCGDQATREFISGQWATLSSRAPRISGADLVARGYPPGPAIGEALEETLRARIGGRISAREELDFASHWLDRHPRTHRSDRVSRRSGARRRDPRSSS